MTHKQEPVDGTKGDVTTHDNAKSWFYTDVVKDHFFHPRHFMHEDANESDYNAIGKVGSPACGDELRVWMRVDPQTERILDFRWKTFGCGSAIASTSMASVMVTENGGMTLEEARKLKPQDIMDRLGGLPQRKFHCSVLCDKALRDAINDYYRRTEQFNHIIVETSRIIDPVSKVTDHDIERSVLEGAHTLELVQQKTKVGIGNPNCLPAVEELIRFYKEKYFG
ncbi:MAG: Nitrogen-fixing NifU domain protein [Candidatus Uhrbacteria bacterium GW2011_GWF2_39_13]|uniref:Nitrogen-fixing NifU domain protein n=1 Tax=Candidatus Uhrbacteria bacterium GW2011_GWF2_39_13 TaxID=1618995 RepID=A0A0G0MJP4_9BACT|nr:MAG: Nitrogen-fixing NifU domain protein [Candidatus Uhrbacteria bacterium GW2011_GWF2_39_13]HAU65798.1 iron-sulfur cluster assembly scaffold protein [Candidatus Uhrbacteria bacterium]